MKSVYIVILCLFMFTTTVIGTAQADTISLDYRITKSIFSELGSIVNVMNRSETDADTQEILSYVNYQLSLIAAGLLITLPEEAKQQDIDQFALIDDEVEITEKSYSVAPTYIPEIGYGQKYAIYKKGDYARIESTVLDPELKETYEFVRIEYATRPETSENMIMLTLLKYDDTMTSSNRYLVYSTDAETKSLFRRTFGSDLNFRIDLFSWSSGQEYVWEDKLLYPAME